MDRTICGQPWTPVARKVTSMGKFHTATRLASFAVDVRDQSANTQVSSQQFYHSLPDGVFYKTSRSRSFTPTTDIASRDYSASMTPFSET